MRRQVENKWSAWRYLEQIRLKFGRGEFTVKDLSDSMRVNRDKKTVRQVLDNLVQYRWLNTERKDTYVDVERGSGINSTRYKRKKEDMKHYRVTNKFNKFVRNYGNFKPKNNPFIKVPRPKIRHKWMQERFNTRFKVYD